MKINIKLPNFKCEYCKGRPLFGCVSCSSSIRRQKEEYLSKFEKEHDCPNCTHYIE